MKNAYQFEENKLIQINKCLFYLENVWIFLPNSYFEDHFCSIHPNYQELQNMQKEFIKPLQIALMTL